MLGTYSYNEIFRKTVVAFGTLFNNIELRRSNETMKVPLAYGPKQKFLARLDQTPDPTNKRLQITLPRISFEINGISYDSTRKVSPTQKVKVPKDSDGNYNIFMPVPYTLNFELAIISKTQEDGLQILEQILPNFQPHYNLSVKLLPSFNEIKDVPVVLQQIQYEDSYEGNFAQRRAHYLHLTIFGKNISLWSYQRGEDYQNCSGRLLRRYQRQYSTKSTKIPCCPYRNSEPYRHRFNYIVCCYG